MAESTRKPVLTAVLTAALPFGLTGLAGAALALAVHAMSALLPQAATIAGGQGAGGQGTEPAKAFENYYADMRAPAAQETQDRKAGAFAGGYTVSAPAETLAETVTETVTETVAEPTAVVSAP